MALPFGYLPSGYSTHVDLGLALVLWTLALGVIAAFVAASVAREVRATDFEEAVPKRTAAASATPFGRA